MTNDVLQKFRLDGKVCLVTGASRGLGRAMAVTLAEAGAQVAAVARSEKAIEETAEIIKAHEGRAIAVPCDVHDTKSVTAMVERVLAEFGQIDVLVNNAGGGDMKPIIEMNEDEWLRIVDLNVNSIFRICKAVGPHMIKRRRGKVINMSSMYGLVGEKNVTAYCASKGAIIQLTRALALEWAEYNITVNALAPGYIYTERTSRVFDNPELRDALTRRVPLGRIGQPVELGPLVVYLASDASDFMTGSVLVIDGGQTAA
ncbi:MAG TPA: glucose 1-dehydrogenase [Pyrinomonadaceae bacterium]|nr:glucose 1-dehydrogenase [Pyrinomonadaceae bacterium]